MDKVKLTGVDKWQFGTTGRLGGFEVHVSEYITSPEWKFPYRRFVEWEAKDEEWARKLGFGYEGQGPGKDVIKIGNRLLMHPKLFELLRKTI